MINWGARKKGGVWYPEAKAYFAIGLVNNVQRWPQDPYFPFSSLYNVVLHGVEVWKNPTFVAHPKFYTCTWSFPGEFK